MKGGRHAGRTVLVTGGGSGIGLATAMRFAAEGSDLFIIGRDRARLEAAAMSINAETGTRPGVIAGDVADPSSVTAMVAEFLRARNVLDVLINNAGLSSPSTATDDERFADDVRERLTVDVLGSALTTSALAPHIRPGGAVLMMGSIYATTPASGTASYSAAKSAVVGLTRSYAVELGPRGIRVNCVSPGWVEVEKWSDYFDAATLQYLRTGFERVPLRSAVTADEVAAVYSFLAHEDARAISGQEIVVDRGMSSDLYVLPTIPGLS